MGRESAAYPDTEFISQEAEWFLAGILDGIADGMSARNLVSRSNLTDFCSIAVVPLVRPSLTHFDGVINLTPMCSLCLQLTATSALSAAKHTGLPMP